MKKVRIGFVGAGAMGQCAHLVNYASLETCEIVALAELRPGLARQVARRYNIERIYPDHHALLQEEELDAIVASQPYNRHGILLPDLFKAGVPVFTEKPLTCSIEAGEQIIQELEASAAKHYLGYHKRSDPATKWVRNEITRLKQSGELGPLQYIRILMPAGDWIASGFVDLLSSTEPLEDLPTDRLPSDMEPVMQQAYDTFVNYYIHQVNLLRHLLGESYSVSYADPTGRIMVTHSESGIPGTIEMSPYETTIDWQEEVLVAFAHGWIKLTLPAPLARNRCGKVSIYYDGERAEHPCLLEPTFPWVHAMRQQAIHFIEAVEGKETPLCEAHEALEDLKIARDYLRLLHESK